MAEEREGTTAEHGLNRLEEPGAAMTDGAEDFVHNARTPGALQ